MTGAGTNRSKPSLGGGPAIILVRPQLAVNIGMCARAMANFGLTDLRLVAPREGWPRSGAYRKGAYAAAAGAVHLLEAARLFETVEAAILDLNFVWASTARERGQHKPILTPAEAMPKSARKITSGEKHGVLFGPERTGLANDEVALADAILTFPVNPAFASLNLAQAVLLTGYEWMGAATDAKPPFTTVQRSPAASREMALSFFDYLETELERAGFFRPKSKQPVMRRNLRNMFHRMQLTEQDVRSLRGMVVRLVEGPRTGGERGKNPRRGDPTPPEPLEARPDEDE
ncbi:MAG: putative tRNA/rRNA methyltransferase [Beijerinckiaceae bacterium]|jgi:tRNA/rRNA methyltransferase|nr:MAG: putative tRNA/rRNA methyltransferase [Beijerinckiaceae bacterium]